jgi:8-oxo-dGTP pyrophosphatase MutT (NUDIX family)
MHILQIVGLIVGIVGGLLVLLFGNNWFQQAHGLSLFEWLRRRFRSRSGPVSREPAANFIPRLNAFFRDDVEVQLLAHEPTVIKEKDHLLLSSTEEGLAATFRASLPINDPVAVLSREPKWRDKPLVLHVHATDYAAVCALDKSGKRPTMLSANVVVVCQEAEVLVLQRRAELVNRDHEDALHTFGGAYMPADQLSMLSTALRELGEESHLSFDPGASPPLLVGRERKIGFLHVALIGVNVSLASLRRAEALPPPSEGPIVRIPWNELPRRLIDETWVPAGKCQVLSWLALGAPQSAGRAPFGGESGQELFNRIVP